MSQENPTPQTPKPREGRQQRYQRRLPFWKAKTVQLLRGTIGVLETTVEKLEEPSSSRENSIFDNIQSGWSGILNQIRRIIPSSLSSKLSNTVLTGIITIITIVVIWGTSSFTSKPPTQVATAPPQLEPTTTATPEPTPSLIAEPIPSPVTEPTPSLIAEPTPSLIAEPTVSPVAEPTPSTIAETPVTEEPTSEAAPTLAPTPQFIPLTPEQILIAAIENQISKVSNNTFAGIVKSIEANFRNSRLIVKISDDWYTLKKSQQDKLAAEMFQRSQDLDFSHLDILDSQDTLVARNPVVGNEMIILQRKSSNEQTS
ncbi:MAG: hypothetical protein IGS39_03805 [Calothrix sp. C42_A2020_038]|nr:hypothetical protein [Calothrix sp. C42_A2020_038]